MNDFNELLKFWFNVNDVSELISSDYKHNSYLWFNINFKNDQLIKSKYESLLENGDIQEWLKNDHGLVAAIVLYDQFPYFIYRGSVKMFSYNSKAVSISLDLINDEQKLNELSNIEKFFVYLCLTRSEDLGYCEIGLKGIETIYNQCSNKEKQNFSKYYEVTKNYYNILKQYGRYPERNSLLGRESTYEEFKVLEKFKYRLTKTITATTKPSTKASVKNHITEMTYDIPKPKQQRILFLHGFRQNASKIKKRLSKLLRALHDQCNTSVIFLNGTHPYRPEGESDNDLLNSIQAQRIWFNSNDDGTVYNGIEDSIDYIVNYAKNNGPFDGLAGFSQGGTLACLITTKHPELFRYFISISGFDPTAIKYKLTIDHLIDCPSLHVYGKKDILVEPIRSENLASLFKNCVIAQHSAGHFAPDSWPVDKVVDFVKSQSKLATLDTFKTDTLADKIEFIRKLVERNELKNFDLDKVKWNTIEHELDNILLSFYFDFLNRDGSNTNTIFDIFFKAYEKNSVYSQEFLTSIRLKTNDLIQITNYAYLRQPEFYKAMIEIFTNQLINDMKLFDLKYKTDHFKKLINKSIISNELSCTEISDLAKFIPRIKSGVDKNSRIAKNIAIKLNPFDEQNKRAKIESYIKYRKILIVLNNFQYNKSIAIDQDPIKDLKSSRSDLSILIKLLNAPLSDAILNPVPEPVDIISVDQMKPLVKWLIDNEKCNLPIQFFTKGAVTTDGRLDLCKQVIGPDGMDVLLNALKNNKQIERLLLGNNLVGDSSGKLIGDFIKSGQSNLTCWYIAGNNLTVDGISHIADALQSDEQVTDLWLKRNPLKASGMVPLANLLKVNHTLKVLDLLNCGLLDDGVNILFDGLKENKTLEHLYLSANGITPVGASRISEHFKTGESSLLTLFLSANRLGDEGVKHICDGLKYDKRIQKLGLACCRFGPIGMKYLTDLLSLHPCIDYLDIGYLRSTVELGELGNFIQDEGAMYLANLLEKNQLPRLRFLSVIHNHITQAGMYMLVNALKFNTSLIQFDYVQYGSTFDDYLLSLKQGYLEKNKDLLMQSQPNFNLESIIMPEHVNKIYSVYRTH